MKNLSNEKLEQIIDDYLGDNPNNIISEYFHEAYEEYKVRKWTKEGPCTMKIGTGEFNEFVKSFVRDNEGQIEDELGDTDPRDPYHGKLLVLKEWLES